MATFIPAGKTSLIKRHGAPLQVQTEYAYRPYPRITTTILNNGQVLHKVEKKLENAIESLDEQNQVEVSMQQQHADILTLIQAVDVPPVQDPSTMEAPGAAVNAASSPTAEPTMEAPRDYPTGSTGSTGSTAPPLEPAHQPLQERFAAVPGFECAFQIDNDGVFKTQAAEERFKRAFKDVHKELLTVMAVFALFSDVAATRERGVCEVVQNRLYLVSMGEECLFISVRAPQDNIEYEKLLAREVLGESELMW